MRSELRYWLALVASVLVMGAVIFDGTYRGPDRQVFIWAGDKWLYTYDDVRIPIITRIGRDAYDRLAFSPHMKGG